MTTPIKPNSAAYLKQLQKNSLGAVANKIKLGVDNFPIKIQPGNDRNANIAIAYQPRFNNRNDSGYNEVKESVETFIVR